MAENKQYDDRVEGMAQALDTETQVMVDLSKPKTPWEYLRLLFTGFAMGASDLVPGVSGGTMAFILGVYETLINAIKSFNVRAARLLLAGQLRELVDHVSLRFLIPLGLGIGLAIILLANLLSSLLENQPMYLFAFFGGLILASILSVGLKIRWSVGATLALIAASIGAFIVVGLPVLEDVSHDPLTLFLSGMVAICAMILPGVSGSFILLVLGQYEYVLNAVKDREIVTIAVVGIGAVVGIMAFSRVLSWLLRHYENTTIAVLVGFMVGSLRVIWQRIAEGAQQVPDFGAGAVVLAAALLLGGFLLVSFLDHLQSRSNPVFRVFGGSRGDRRVVTSQG